MTEVIEILKNNAVALASVLTAIGVIWKWCGKPLKEMNAKFKQMDQDLSDLMWDQLATKHEQMTERGWASVEEKQRVVLIHKHYAAAKRNHLADSF